MWATSVARPGYVKERLARARLGVSVDSGRIVGALSLEEATAAYRALRRQVIDAGLLERAPSFYLRTCVQAYVLVAVGILLALWLPSGLTWTLAAALVLGFGIVQVALVGHDAGHLAVFRDPRRNHLLGLACWSLTAGVGFWYWCDRHNRHHAHTNDLEGDPDLGWTALIAYDEDQAARRRGWLRAITPYQAFVAASFVPVVAYGFRVESWVFALRRLRGRRKWVEVGLLAANLLLWGYSTVILGWRGIVLFIATNVVASAYLSFIIAPNHKGMPFWTRGVRLSFVERQVLSSRNLTAHPAWDYLFGGLNYQIEHHLFPQMPRVHFRRAATIVAPLCRRYALAYEVEDPVRIFADIFVRAHRVGQAARRQARVTAISVQEAEASAESL